MKYVFQIPIIFMVQCVRAARARVCMLFELFAIYRYRL